MANSRRLPSPFLSIEEGENEEVEGRTFPFHTAGEEDDNNNIGVVEGIDDGEGDMGYLYPGEDLRGFGFGSEEGMEELSLRLQGSSNPPPFPPFRPYEGSGSRGPLPPFGRNFSGFIGEEPPSHSRFFNGRFSKSRSSTTVTTPRKKLSIGTTSDTRALPDNDGKTVHPLSSETTNRPRSITSGAYNRTIGDSTVSSRKAETLTTHVRNTEGEIQQTSFPMLHTAEYSIPEMKQNTTTHRFSNSTNNTTNVPTVQQPSLTREQVIIVSTIIPAFIIVVVIGVVLWFLFFRKKGQRNSRVGVEMQDAEQNNANTAPEGDEAARSPSALSKHTRSSNEGAKQHTVAENGNRRHAWSNDEVRIS